MRTVEEYLFIYAVKRQSNNVQSRRQPRERVVLHSWDRYRRGSCYLRLLCQSLAGARLASENKRFGWNKRRRVMR